MKIISAFLLLFFMSQSIKIDFTESEDWYVLSDGVMGGLSKGRTVESKEGIVFFGSVSLANNGGFTSYRGPWQNYNFREYETVTIKYRSEGMRMAFVMETSQRFWVPNYKVNLENSDDWLIQTFDLDDFKQYRLGNGTGKSLTQDSKDDIIRIGFITNEKRAGDFKFEVSSIDFR